MPWSLPRSIPAVAWAAHLARAVRDRRTADTAGRYRRVASGLILLTVLVLAPATSAAQDACSFYRVQRGDTLQGIAEAAYGTDDYRLLWRENRGEIGRNPNIILPGTVLSLPCRDGTSPSDRPVGGAATISLVTANGYLPYADESLPGRGIMVRLVKTALLRALPATPAEVVFVNDWAAHLDALLPRRAFDASFPQTRPGCETQGTLTSRELSACRNYVYSEPFFEIVEGFFARAGSGFDTATDFVDLEGARICRPEGYATGHLEEAGLIPPAVTLVQGDGPHACFARLEAGDVDLVAIDTRTGERVAADLGLSGDVLENPNLYAFQPLQVALHRDNPGTETLRAALNTGLGIMLESGEWDSIVSEGLRDHGGPAVN